MKRQSNKNKGKASNDRSSPKAKVSRSNRLGCTSLTLPSPGQTTEIPSGYEVVERITCENFKHKLTLFLRPTYPSSFEIHLKSRRVGKHASRSA